MYYILCIHCGEFIEIPADDAGLQQTHSDQVVTCDQCGISFDFAAEQVQLL